MRYGLGIITVFIATIVNFIFWWKLDISQIPILAALSSYGTVSVGIVSIPFGGFAVTGFVLALLFTLILPFRGDNNPFLPAWFAATLLPAIIIVILETFKAGLF